MRTYCECCEKYEEFEYVGIDVEFNEGGQGYFVEMCECSVCHEQKAMSTFVDDVPRLENE